MKKNPVKMNCLDIYLSELPKSEFKKIEQRIESSDEEIFPLMSWDIFMERYKRVIRQKKLENDLSNVLSFAKTYNWKNNLEQAFEENEYEALVITDVNQNIVWVNNGFTEMTGYSKTYAKNKTPRFLHGSKTSKASRESFRRKLAENKPFESTIINYRKDKSTYKCHVKIIPLFDEKTTHYIAFEREVG